MNKKKQMLDYTERKAMRTEMDRLILCIKNAVHSTPNLYAKKPDIATIAARQSIDMMTGTVYGLARTLGIKHPFAESLMDSDIDAMKLAALDHARLKQLTLRIEQNIQIIYAWPETESLVFCPAAIQLQKDMAEFEKLHGMPWSEYIALGDAISRSKQKER